MDQSDQKPKVPKFASFQAKKPEQAEPKVKKQRVEDEETRSSRKHGESRSRRGQSTDAVTSKRHQDHGHSRHSQEKPKNVTVSSLSSHVANSDLFAIDRRGDTAILTYGSLSRSEIPRFHRMGHGYIVGLGREHRIDRAESDYKSMVTKPRSAFKSDATRKYSTTVAKAPKVIKSDDSKQQLDLAADYVSFGKKRRRDDDPSHFKRSLGFDTSRDGANQDSDLEDFVESDSEPDYNDQIETGVRLKHSKLAALVDSEPQNLSNWLDLINLQDQIVALGKTSLREDGKLGLSKLKISLYQQALDKIRRDENARETLRLGILDEASRSGDSERLRDLWRQAVEDNPRSIKIRIGYINYLQRSANEFRFENCKQEFLQCFSFLARNLESESDSGRISDLLHGQAYLLLRFSAFARDSGYHELSLASWQAVLDFTIPIGSDNLPQAEAFALFEQFWESEVPRLGENGYDGWRRFNPRVKHDLPSPIIVPKRNLETGENIWKSFVEGEMMSAVELMSPGRTIDEAGEDDPFHIVLFSDLQPILETLPSPFKKPELLLSAFLCYAGLPPIESDLIDTISRSWWEDSYVRAWPMPFKSPSAMESIFSHDTLPSFWTFRRMTTDLLFGDGFKDLVVPSSAWTGRILKFFCERFSGNDELAEYYIAYLLATSGPKVASQSAKQLLKSRKSSIRLYNAYAITELAGGNTENSENVFVATITGLAKSLPEKDKKDVILLRRTWIWQKLDYGNIREAISMLYSSVIWHIPKSDEAVTPDAARFLAARQLYQEGLSQSRLANDAGMGALYAELSALLTYFHHDQSLDAAMQEYKRLEQFITSDELFALPYREMLHQYRTKLLLHHVETVKLHQPSEILGWLMESVKAFPRNTEFIVAYTNHQRQFGVDDRLRSLFSKNAFLGMDQSLSNWYSAIWAEAKRGPDFGGTVHGMRSVLNRAIESTVGRNSPSLWMTFLNFEISRGSSKTVQDLVFRGMAHVPWSKWFIMSGMNNLIDVLSINNVGARLINIMELRELRIHGTEVSAGIDLTISQRQRSQ